MDRPHLRRRPGWRLKPCATFCPICSRSGARTRRPDSPRWSPPSTPRRALRGLRWWSPRRPRVRFGVRRVRRGRGLRIGVRDGPDGEADPRAVRRQRRRRVRGRAHVRRHPGRVRRAGLSRHVSRTRRRRRRHRGAASGGGGDGRRRRRRSRRAAPGNPTRRRLGDARFGPARRRGRRRRPRSARGGRTAVLAYGPDGQRRGEGLRVFVASYAPPPRMLVFGAIDFAAAVARQGSSSDTG